jgi:hypothetical protein
MKTLFDQPWPGMKMTPSFEDNLYDFFIPTDFLEDEEVRIIFNDGREGGIQIPAKDQEGFRIKKGQKGDYNGSWESSYDPNLYISDDDATSNDLGADPDNNITPPVDTADEMLRDKAPMQKVPRVSTSSTGIRKFFKSFWS